MSRPRSTNTRRSACSATCGSVPACRPRDRSVVTLAALIARNQTIEMPFYLGLALDNGVKPREISEIITHLAFYAGWANAMSAVTVAKDVFAARNIGADQIPAVSPQLLALNETAEADRAKRVGDQFGAVFPGMTQYTTDVLFRDLWLRPDLAPRDRSLVDDQRIDRERSGRSAHRPYQYRHEQRPDAGEIAEAITHLAFYVGWPNSFSAMPVAKDVFEKRPR